MADNITLNPGTGGPEVRTIDRAGIETQVMALDIGGAGAESLVTAANPLPVELAALPLPPNAATASAQATGNTTLASILTALGQTLAVGGSVTVSNLPATQPVSGTVTANLGTLNGAATSAKQDAIITALGSPLQANGTVSIAGTVPVSGPLTDAQLRATAVPVSGTVGVSGSVSVTGTFWQATQPVSGPLTNAELRAAPVPVTMPNMTLASYNQAGVITINTDLLVIDCQGLEGVSIQCAAMGTAGVVTPAWSNDGTNFLAATINTPAGTAAQTFNAAGLWTTPVLARYLRLRLTTATTGGTTTLAVQGIAQAANFPVASQPVAVTSALVAGANTIGNVGIVAGTANIGNLPRQSGFTDSSTPLAANATFTGTGRATTGANYPKFAANVFADQAGTLFIDLSLDTGTTYRTIKTVAVSANTAAEAVANVTGAAGAATLYRVRFTNGATLQTAFQISSAFIA